MWQAGDKLGRFRLDKEIGQGSHGVVWTATDTALDAQIAVKILHPWLTEDMAVRERFKRELLLARRIAHPGICRLFDLHQEADAFFITMDYVEGQTLLNILKNEGRLLPARGVKILRGVCQALAAAHAAGVIHRDLKPANIIVRAGDNPMILDFGTATAGDVSRVTRPGTAVGSMRFIAPEVFTGVAPSPLTDLYSLGVVAYVTFAGKLPYNAAAGAIEMLEAIRSQPPQRIDAIQPDVPARLADVVGRAMEKNPEARFATALAFDEALAEVERQLDPAAAAKNKPPPATGDFARWAPSQVIRDSIAPAAAGAAIKPAGGGPAPAIAPAGGKTPAALKEPAITRSNPMMAQQTAVDLRPADLSLGTQIPSTPSSSALPIVTGAAVIEPNTDEAPRPVSIPTDPSAEAPDTVENVAPVLSADEFPIRPLEPTVRVARIDLGLGPDPAVGGRPRDKRMLIAAALAVVVVIVAVIVGVTRSGGEGSADAGVLAVIPAPTVPDAGTKVAAMVDAGAKLDGAVDAGEAVAVVVDAGGAGDPVVKGEGEMAFEGEGEPVNPPDHTTFTGPHLDARVELAIGAVHAAMRSKGILGADLPAVEAQLAQAHRANAHGHKNDAEKLVAAAKSTVDAQAVDRGFVMAKLGRFNKAFDKSKRPDIADKVEPLARQAAATFSAGQFEAANKKLNQAFGLVGKSK